MAAWVATLRVRLLRLEPDGRARLSDGAGERLTARSGRVVAFLHGHQMGLLGARALLRPGATVLVSRSRDGDIQRSVMAALGFRVIRGSSARGGAAAVKALVRALRAGCDVAIAVDGPRGPLGVPKPGAAAAARLTGAELVLAASAPSRAWTLRNTWDQFRIPLPFSRVVVAHASLTTSGWPASRHGEGLMPRPPPVQAAEVGSLLAVLDAAAGVALASDGDSWQTRLAEHVPQAGDD